MACGQSADAPDAAAGRTPETAIAIRVIDSTIAPAVAGEDGWNFVQRATADLDGDGAPEQAVLTARVELYRGRPAWDDGQPWQVYVESPGGERTYLYAQRLQLGTITMRIAAPDTAGQSSVVLLEQLPQQLTVYEAQYETTGSARVFMRYQRTLDPRGPSAVPQLP